MLRPHFASRVSRRVRNLYPQKVPFDPNASSLEDVATMRYEVILDSGETPNKCTIAPLSYRPDFRLMRVSSVLALGPFTADILLHPEGECLLKIRNSLKNISGIASIDCIWRRLPNLMVRLSGKVPTLVKIPEGFVTAYPRRTSDNTDPTGGLATIEALFIAASLVGHWDATLLCEYYFGTEFVKLNTKRFLELGVKEAGDEKNFPKPVIVPRHSRFRRSNRSQVKVPL